MKEFILKRPSAWLPLLMSFLAMVILFGYVLAFGVSKVPQEDEGAAARIFQLLFVGQLPVISYFVIRWAGKYPEKTIRVLILQIVLILLAVVSIFILEL